MRAGGARVNIGRIRHPLLWIFLLGLVLRLAFLAGAEITGKLEIAEGAIFRNLALNLLEGRGLSISEDLLALRPGVPDHVREVHRRWIESGGLFGMIPPGRPTAFFMPLYPIFLAGVFAIFGAGYLPARLVQMLLSALLPLVAHDIARRAVDRETAVAAALLTAVHPYFIYYAGLLVTQVLFVLLLGLATTAYYRLRERPTAGKALLLGGWLGLSFLVRTFAITFLPLLLLVLMFELGGGGRDRRGLVPGAAALRRAAFCAVMVVLAFAVILSPWVIRNQLVFGEPLVLPTKGGRNLWEYNNQKFSTEFELAENPWTQERYRKIREQEMGQLKRRDTVEFPVFRPEQPEPERDRILNRNVRAFILANPRVYFRLCLIRASEMVRVTPVRKTSPLLKVVAWLTIGWQLPMALLGMVMLAPRWRRGPLYLYVLSLFYLLLHALVASGTPHRVQVDLFLLIFCAYPLSRLLLWVGSFRRRSASEGA